MIRFIGWAGVCTWLCLGLARAIENSDFEKGLQAWKAAWHVASAEGEAVLSDAQDTHAFLFQADDGLSGPVTVAFDFFNALSDDVPDGAFRDSFYASVYQVDTLSDFVLEHDQFDASQGLMDLDAGGAFDVQGSVAASPRGGGWLRFEGTINAVHAYVVVVFELHDLNVTAGDSSVRLDDVTVQGAAP